MTRSISSIFTLFLWYHTVADLREDLKYIWSVDDGLYVQNNAFLTNASTLQGVDIILADSSDECTVVMENNTKLDTDGLCSEGYLSDLMSIQVKGNLKDCGCRTPTCDNLYGGLSISNSTVPPTVSDIHTIREHLVIENTNLQNLSIFKNLKFLKSNTVDGFVLDIKDNPQMTRLAFPVLEVIKNAKKDDGYTYINLENLHPDFCLTQSEFGIFENSDVTFHNLDAKLCDSAEEIEGLCHFKSMKELPNNCATVIGDIKIGPGDEEHVTKLLNMFSLYGSLEIRETSLQNLSFLYSIMNIYSLGDSPVIQIIGNRNLTQPTFGIVTRVYTRYSREAIIQDNHPDIFNSTDGVCDVFGIIPLEKMMFQRRLNYTGSDCESSTEEDNDNGRAQNNHVSFKYQHNAQCSFEDVYRKIF
uniref:Recep_L_domain domain-containing protein n=1 Tax=Caenorhabditis tropicalis TaxID=1561998 RepID=A0A1I7UE27_9PELO